MPPAPLAGPSSRIVLVDALRGFALAGIMVLHSLEQFNLRSGPRSDALWALSSDAGVWNSLFFLFGGKAYAIFCVLFGFTFWIMFSSRLGEGTDFGPRFLWRMVLLAGFGLLHSVFYDGDILLLYAALGGVLVIARRWSDRAVLILAIALLLQPLQLWQFVHTLIDPQYTPPGSTAGRYFQAMGPLLTGDSFVALVKGNLTDGLRASLLWCWDVGRVFQAPGLFLLGMLVARRRLLATPSRRFWLTVLAVGGVAFAILHPLLLDLGDLPLPRASRRPLRILLSAYRNLAFMLVLVSGFTLLWRLRFGERILGVFSAYGRMSLTNYLAQSVLGTALYYGWGVGLFRYLGHTLSAAFGLVLLACLMVFSHGWLSRNSQGPLEALWSKGTWAWSKPRSKPQ